MLDHLVHRFDLPIGLRSCDRREYLLDLVVVAEFLEFVVVKMRSIIRYDGVGDSIPVDDVLVDELLDLRRRDRCKRFCFNLFSEVVDSNYHVLHTTSSFEKSVDPVDSLDGKWRAGHGRKFLWMSFRYRCKSLALVAFVGVFHVVCLHHWPVVPLP